MLNQTNLDELGVWEGARRAVTEMYKLRKESITIRSNLGKLASAKKMNAVNGQATQGMYAYQFSCNHQGQRGLLHAFIRAHFKWTQDDSHILPLPLLHCLCARGFSCLHPLAGTSRRQTS